MSDKQIIPKVYEYTEDYLPNFDGKYRVLDEPIIKYVTSRVRRTIEYRNLIDYMKRTMNINRCTFYKDYSMENGFTIELHHAPLTLYDIVEAVCHKHFELDKDDPHFEPWRVEEEVNLLHYEFLVGLIPLNPTAHKLVHSDALKVHPRMVEGNWKKFHEKYSKWMSDAARGKIEEFIMFGKTNPDEIPDIVKYTPTMLSSTRFKSLGTLNIKELIVEKHKERFMELQNKSK